jgi:hypothetical protein
MEREFMVWVGSGQYADGYVEREEHERFPAVIHATNYFAALAALLVFRAEPENAVVAYDQMNAAKRRTYINSYLRLYETFKAESQDGVPPRTM